MLSSLALICVSTYLIWKASTSFDLASSYLTRHLNEGIKGPTVSAIASSLPELLISFFFLFYIGDIQGFSAGFATIIGSSIFNIAIIPTACFLVIYYQKGKAYFPIDKKIIQQDGFFLIVTEIVLIVGLYIGGISMLLSIILILLYGVYIFLVFLKRGGTSYSKDSLEEHPKVSVPTTLWRKIIDVDIASLVLGNRQLTTIRSLIIFIISLFIISLSCKQLVNSSEHLSHELNLNIFFVTFFIAAVASSIPDTILSIQDAKNGKYKDAFSNAYGSNIFDICIGIGLPVLMYLFIHGMDELATASGDSISNRLIVVSSILLLIFSITITLIYWLKSINLTRSIIVFLLYLSFLGLIFYLS